MTTNALKVGPSDEDQAAESAWEMLGGAFTSHRGEEEAGGRREDSGHVAGLEARGSWPEVRRTEE